MRADCSGADRLLQSFSIIDPFTGRERAATATSVEDYRDFSEFQRQVIDAIEQPLLVE